MSTSPPITKFWSWFSANYREISEAYDCGDSERLERLFTNRLPDTTVALNWEMGPYHDPDYTLVLSPTVRENIPLTKRMVSEAPLIPGWHFLPAKPPKELLSLRFELPQASVCADDWRYVLLAYPDGFMELDILIPANAPFSDSQDPLICELLVESLIGEAARLEHIGRITPLRVDAASASRGIAITSLKDHINERLHE
jgi:hypothetical protein